MDKLNYTMKKSLFTRSVLFFCASFLLFSCNKEGLGGTSTIEGTIKGIDHDDPEAEITQITFTNGNVVEHGDYFTLNSPDTDQYFYVWYKNPTWISDGDPALQNRIGISVTFNYSNSNLEIAQNTKDAIENATGMFSTELLNDILLLTALVPGTCPDAEDVSSPFAIDIINQGKASSTANAIPLVDEKIYIVYGSNTIANDDVRSVAEGRFQFNGLQKGNYTIYATSKDTLNGGNIVVSKSISIPENKSLENIGDLIIVY